MRVAMVNNLVSQPPVTEIQFANGNRAPLVTMESSFSVESILRVLGLDHKAPVILLLGGEEAITDDVVRRRVFELLRRGLVRAAMEVNEADEREEAGGSSWILGGGAMSGVSEQIGLAVAKESGRVPLVGVVPESAVCATPPPEGAATEVSLDPNHTHFVLTPGDRLGDETEALFHIVSELWGPTVAVIAGSGEVAARGAARAVRSGLPVLVVEGTGGFADALAAASQERSSRSRPKLSAGDGDDLMADILEEARSGQIRVFRKTERAGSLREVIVRRMLWGAPKPAILADAWRMFATWDRSAFSQLALTFRLESAVLWVAVLTTLLALIRDSILTPSRVTGARLLEWSAPVWLSRVQHLLAAPSAGGRAPADWLQWPIFVLPLITAAILQYNKRFRPETRSTHLRKAATDMMREIVLYRMRAGAYAPSWDSPETPESRLGAKIGDIRDRLTKADPSLAVLGDYDGAIPPEYALAAGDDGISFLLGSHYVDFRLHDSLSYRHRMARRLSRQLTRYEVYIYAASGAASLLVACGLGRWTALTSGLVATFAGTIAYKQLEHSLDALSVGASELEKIQTRWSALNRREQRDLANLERLVTDVEAIISGELPRPARRTNGTAPDR
jgi:hypothetical protein